MLLRQGRRWSSTFITDSGCVSEMLGIPSKKNQARIKGAFIMKEIPGACRVKQSLGECHCFPRWAVRVPTHAGSAQQQPNKTKRGQRQRHRLGAPTEPVAWAARWQTSSWHQRSQDFTCETVSEVSTQRRKRKPFIHYFHFIISVAQQRSQKALAGLWDAPEVNKKLAEQVLP